MKAPAQRRPPSTQALAQGLPEADPIFPPTQALAQGRPEVDPIVSSTQALAQILTQLELVEFENTVPMPFLQQLPIPMQQQLALSFKAQMKAENLALARRLDESETFGNHNGKLDPEELEKFMTSNNARLEENPNDSEAVMLKKMGTRLSEAVNSGEQFQGWPARNSPAECSSNSSGGKDPT